MLVAKRQIVGEGRGLAWLPVTHASWKQVYGVRSYAYLGRQYRNTILRAKDILHIKERPQRFRVYVGVAVQEIRPVGSASTAVTQSFILVRRSLTGLCNSIRPSL